MGDLSISGSRRRELLKPFFNDPAFRKYSAGDVHVGNWLKYLFVIEFAYRFQLQNLAKVTSASVFLRKLSRQAGFLPARNDPAPEPRNGALSLDLVQFDAVLG